jgi:sec-independent protein translocase protein TatC
MTPDGVAMMTDIAHYLDFVLTTFFAFGVCFEVPVAIVIIAALGWFTPAQMAAARRYVILGATVASAILAPPDATSMLLLAIPLCILFEVGLVAARLVTPRERAASA